MSSEWKPPEFMKKALSDDGSSFLLEKKRNTDRDLLKLAKTKTASTPRKVNKPVTPKKKKKIKSPTPKANKHERNTRKSNKPQKTNFDPKISANDKTYKLKKKKSKQINSNKNNIKSTKIKKKNKKNKMNESQNKMNKQQFNNNNVSDNDDTFLNEMVNDMSTKEQQEMESILSDDENDKWNYYNTLNISDNEKDNEQKDNNNCIKIPMLNTNESVVNMLLTVDMNNNVNELNEWNYDDALNISDESDTENDVNALIVPAFEWKTQGSVVDMLISGPYVNKETKQQPINKLICVTTPEQINEKKEIIDKEKDEWHYDYVLNISDDEYENENDSNALIVPKFELKSQGSVVDMLMTGPYITNKENEQQNEKQNENENENEIENDNENDNENENENENKNENENENANENEEQNDIIEKDCNVIADEKQQVSDVLITFDCMTHKSKQTARTLTIISTEERKGSFKKKIQKHTVYVIKSNPSLNGIKTVSRRYNDFKWLRNILCLQFPGIFVPPLPPPKVIGRFDNSFVKERRQDLERFLNRVEQIKPFSECMPFNMFLFHGIDKTFNEKRKQIEEEIKTKTKEQIANMLNGIFSNLKDSQQELDDKICEDDIPKLREFILKIDNQMNQINKSAVKLLKHFNSAPKEILLFKESLNGLHLTEDNNPFQTKYKRFDVRERIQLWSEYQTKQTDSYYDNFFRLLRYEQEDIKAFLGLFKYHEELYKKYRKVCTSIEKWNQMESNGIQLKTKQTTQKSIDFIDRKQLSLLLHIVTKIILKHEIIIIWNNKMNLWKERIQQFSKMHKQITNKMLNEWKIDNELI